MDAPLESSWNVTSIVSVGLRYLQDAPCNHLEMEPPSFLAAAVECDCAMRRSWRIDFPPLSFSSDVIRSKRLWEAKERGNAPNSL